MAPSRIVTITYNLYDRDRKLSGADRSDVSIPAMIVLLNSSLVQEQIAKGDLIGYYGHQVRQRFGMRPPETAFVDGREIRLEPAVRTLSVSADTKGNVTHQQEFLDNDAGELARKQYAAKVGGFSIAADYEYQGNQLVPVLFAGFDYVWQANYAKNTTFGQFDSANNPAAPMINELLENQIVQLYDSIQMNSLVGQLASDSMQAQQELDALKRRQALQQKRNEELRLAQYDSALCQEIPFEDFMSQSNEFMTGQNIAEEAKPMQDKNELGLFGKFLGAM